MNMKQEDIDKKRKVYAHLATKPSSSNEIVTT